MTSNQNGIMIGSGRSFGDYDLYDALNNSLHFLLQFGGHKKAIGFTLKEKNLLPFKRMMTDYINQTIEMSTIIEKRRLTHYVTLEQISLPLWKELTKLEPYGPGNMRPIFQSKITLDKSMIQLIANKHLKIQTSNRHGQRISFLGYNMGSSLKDIELATSLECEFVIESYLNKDNRTMVCTIKSIKDING